MQTLEISTISPEEYILGEIQKFEQPEDKLQALASQCQSIQVAGIADKDGYEAAKNHWRTLKGTRLAIEAKRKELKEIHVQTGKAIDNEAKRLSQIIEPSELEMEALWRAVDEEKERLRLEEIRSKEAKINGRIAALFQKGFAFNGIDYTLPGLVMNSGKIAEFTDKEWDLFMAAADDELRKEAQRKAEEARLLAEQQAEEARIKAAQEEEARAKAEAERKAQEEENQRMRAENERMRAENEKLAREKREAELKALQAEKDRRESEYKIAEEKRQEQLRLDAIAKAEAETKRLAALMPEKHKLNSFALALLAIEWPEVIEAESIQIVEQAKAKMHTAIDMLQNYFNHQ